MVIVTLITIYTTRLLLEGLGIDDYGIYNVTIGIISLCSFLKPAMANGIQRFYNFEIGKNNYEGAKQVFNTGLQIQLILIIFIVLLCETVGLWYMNNKLIVPPDRIDASLIVYHIAVASFVLTMLEVPFMAAVMGHEKMDFYALISVLDAVLKLGISLSLRFVCSDHLVFYAVLLFAVELINLLLYGLYCAKNFKEIRISKKVSSDLFKPMLSFSGWNLLEKISRLGKDQGINIMLNFFFGPVVNAARGVVNQVSYAFTGLIDSANTAARPQAIQSYASGNQARTLSIMFTMSKFTIILLYVLIFPILLEASYILNLWLGDNVPSYTLPFLNVALLTIIVDKLSTPLNFVVHATGKMKNYNMVSGLLNFIVLPLALVVLVAGMDAVAVYWLVFICTIITQVIYLLVLKKIIDYSISKYLKDVVVSSLLVMIASCFVPYICHLYLPEGFVRLSVVFVASLVAGGFASYFIGLSKAEKNICDNLLYSLLHKRQ